MATPNEKPTDNPAELEKKPWWKRLLDAVGIAYGESKFGK